MEQRRLTRQDWLDAALHALERHGHNAIRPEKLAKQLGVSRGSFYWHFADVPSFEQALLEAWFEAALNAPYSKAVGEAQGSASAALRNLIREAFAVPRATERSVREWASLAPRAAGAVRRMDQQRVELIAGLMPAPEETRYTRAIILYRVYLGHVASPEGDPGGAIRSTLVELFCPSGPAASPAQPVSAPDG